MSKTCQANFFIIIRINNIKVALKTNNNSIKQINYKYKNFKKTSSLYDNAGIRVTSILTIM